jgi:hypothetical protein
VVRILAGMRDFMVSKTDQTGSTAHQAFYSSGTGTKRLKREVNYPLPPNAEVRNEWSCTRTLHACLLVADRKIVTFL